MPSLHFIVGPLVVVIAAGIVVTHDFVGSDLSDRGGEAVNATMSGVGGVKP